MTTFKRQLGKSGIQVSAIYARRSVVAAKVGVETASGYRSTDSVRPITLLPITRPMEST